ncbi:hypothetical protein EMERY_67 [Brevibacillus phage Emery]|nr:hypothetical protein EMERY_67 [Brevibacillus phage Emery]
MLVLDFDWQGKRHPEICEGEHEGFEGGLQMSADDFNRRQAEILAKDSDHEMSLMLPVSGQAVCDRAVKRLEDFCKHYGVEMGSESINEKRKIVPEGYGKEE